MTGPNTPTAIVAIVGDSPAQVVTRALAACRCREPEKHHLFAPDLLAAVRANTGGEPDWPYVLVIADEGGGEFFDLTATGVHRYVNDEAVG